MRKKKVEFLKKINLPSGIFADSKTPEDVSALVEIIERFINLQIPEDISALVKSREGREIVSWLNLSCEKPGGVDTLRKIITKPYDGLTAILDLTWGASGGDVAMGGVESKYGEAIRALQDLAVKYRSGALRRKEIEKDIRRLEKRMKQLSRYKESEFIIMSLRQMIMEQCYGLLDYLSQICPADHFPASKIYVLIAEIISNLYSAKFTPADVKHFCDERKKIS